ncbi:MAG: phosphatidylserine decarboxylase family protein [Bryobacterales bacterium]
MEKDGIYYGVALATAGALVSYFFHPGWGAVFFPLALFCVYFFRDPERVIPDGPVAVSPADGKVVHIRQVDGGRTRVSIFLNIFNVHVNRVPVAGRITEVAYKPGRFVMAHREDASSDNEQNTVTISAGDTQVVTRQIAGLIARRIVCRKKVGDEVQKGERFGLIKFGSRVDVFLGPDWELTVSTGDKVRGGSSILARRRSV